jgi:hypothetical protein
VNVPVQPASKHGASNNGKNFFHIADRSVA